MLWLRLVDVSESVWSLWWWWWLCNKTGLPTNNQITFSNSCQQLDILPCAVVMVVVVWCLVPGQCLRHPPQLSVWLEAPRLLTYLLLLPWWKHRASNQVLASLSCRSHYACVRICGPVSFPRLPVWTPAHLPVCLRSCVRAWLSTFTCLTWLLPCLPSSSSLAYKNRKFTELEGFSSWRIYVRSLHNYYDLNL